MFDDDVRYRALSARDPRFDGHFYVAVSTTGVYCRPVCPARLPRRAHCVFFPSAAAAEAQGFRPCLRCRPELAPGRASVDARQRLARAAAARLEAGLADQDLAGLAAALGVSDRHLRRVFRLEYGVTPVAYAQTQRLLLAKRLLTETGLPVTEVALAAGFGSLRRFNALFRQRYRLKPSSLRRPGGRGDTDSFTLRLAYRPPYDWPALRDFLGQRAIAGVESVEEGSYRRTVALRRGDHGVRGWLTVAPVKGRDQLAVTLSASLAGAVPEVLARLRHLFDLDCQPSEVAAALGPLMAAHPGLRVPGAFDGFEAAVRAVLGQQITVRAAQTLAGRVAAALGEPLETPFAALTHTFPDAATVAATDPDTLGGLGILRGRVGAIRALASACDRGELVLAPGAPVEETLAALKALPGIGDWTAHYLALRALSWPDAFPAADYGVLKALGERSPARARRHAEAWRPWRAYAVMALWRNLATQDAAAQSAQGSGTGAR
ncbi:DNA-3-methyladenine glycosylase 2 [Alcanivorax marinus]|uniref:DNA-3-methyladenine glycosylase II n=2 Tax=Alloalcanivorax marinus TaxID=1177169 RepID=A0A9Q3UNH7_9GAMM|nr:DNA-3-methyladenine glycosylase 2 [Alloalcanivorax marinus]MCC4309655.1 DNA-3-methyladenine glycosylase 2 [Alloalcanivorax marinus]